jgi:hypothetical protein
MTDNESIYDESITVGYYLDGSEARHRLHQPGGDTRNTLTAVMKELVGAGRAPGLVFGPPVAPHEMSTSRWELALSRREYAGGGKSAGIVRLLAQHPDVSMFTVDPSNHLLAFLRWPAPRPRTLIERIDQVIADAEVILGEVRRAIGSGR